jgi:glucokinase
MTPYAVGIDLGGTNLKAALVHRDDGLCAQDRCPTQALDGPDAILERIVRMAEAMKAKMPEDGSFEGIGIGSPGAINWERTTVTQPSNLPGWDTVNLKEVLQRHFGDVTVVVENDANVAGLGSAYYGAGRSFDSFVMATLGTGVGGAIIYQNKIFRGSTGAAGEIGHMTINYEGPYERYGIGGSSEAYLGQQFLSHHARMRLLSVDSTVHDLCGDDLHDLTPRILYEAAQAGDEPARDMLAWAGHKLGCLLGSIVNLLDIRTVIVGGGVSAAGHYLLDPARDALTEYTIPPMRDGLSMKRETLGNEVSLLGAARLVFDPDGTQV